MRPSAALQRRKKKTSNRYLAFITALRHNAGAVARQPLLCVTTWDLDHHIHAWGRSVTSLDSVILEILKIGRSIPWCTVKYSILLKNGNWTTFQMVNFTFNVTNALYLVRSVWGAGFGDRLYGYQAMRTLAGISYSPQTSSLLVLSVHTEHSGEKALQTRKDVQPSTNTSTSRHI